MRNARWKLVTWTCIFGPNSWPFACAVELAGSISIAAWTFPSWKWVSGVCCVSLVTNWLDAVCLLGTNPAAQHVGCFGLSALWQSTTAQFEYNTYFGRKTSRPKTRILATSLIYDCSRVCLVSRIFFWFVIFLHFNQIYSDIGTYMRRWEGNKWMTRMRTCTDNNTAVGIPFDIKFSIVICGLSHRPWMRNALDFLLWLHTCKKRKKSGRT